MLQAATDWEATCNDCGIQFNEVGREDSNRPTPGAVTFVVRRRDGPYYATAFHASWDVSERFVNLDESYFQDDIDHIGILRHELGHILGYVHEHVRAPDLENQVGICKHEIERYEAITDYDPSSVMHFFCGDKETANFSISEEDEVGHRSVYK